MHRKLKISFVLIILIQLFIITSIGCASDNSIDIKLIETFVRNNYLLPDKVYTAIPSNRFHMVKIISGVSFSKQKNQEEILIEIISLKDGFFQVQVLENRKFVSQKIDPFEEIMVGKINPKNYVNRLPFPDSIRKRIYFTELFETQYGTFLFFRLNQLDARSDILSIDDLTDKERDFVEGFMIVSKNYIYAPRFKTQKVDPEKKYSRQLWDVFKLNNQDFILIFNQVYESYEFEIYSLNKNEVKLLHSFQFGGL